MRNFDEPKLKIWVAIVVLVLDLGNFRRVLISPSQETVLRKNSKWLLMKQTSPGILVIEQTESEYVALDEEAELIAKNGVPLAEDF